MLVPLALWHGMCSLNQNSHCVQLWTGHWWHREETNRRLHHHGLEAPGSSTFVQGCLGSRRGQVGEVGFRLDTRQNFWDVVISLIFHSLSSLEWENKVYYNLDGFSEVPCKDTETDWSHHHISRYPSNYSTLSLFTGLLEVGLDCQGLWSLCAGFSEKCWVPRGLPKVAQHC